MLTTSRSEAESSITSIFLAMVCAVLASEEREGFELARSARLACPEVLELLLGREIARHVRHPALGIHRRVAALLERLRELGAVVRHVGDDLAHAVLELELHQRIGDLALHA